MAKKKQAAGPGCPKCPCTSSTVANTVPGDGETTRYRRCLRCGCRYPTVERRKRGRPRKKTEKIPEISARVATGSNSGGGSEVDSAEESD